MRAAKKILISMTVMFMVFFLLCGCGANEEITKAGNVYKIYMVGKEETKINYREEVTAIEKQLPLLEYLMKLLEEAPSDTAFRAAIPPEVSPPEISVTEATVTLDFQEDYYNLSTGGEILSRAAIVRTLTQVPGISYCSFTVAGNSLVSATGSPVGIMRADQFIDNSGNEINTEEKVNLTLYFANESGDGLVEVSREVIYSSNIPIERLVMEQLIAGVTEDESRSGAYSVVNGDTRILSVAEKDGVCYVNLDSGFLAQTLNITPDVALYSVVNSLVELSTVNKVQLSVNGETGILFRDKYLLENQYDRNLELITIPEVEPAGGVENEMEIE